MELSEEQRELFRSLFNLSDKVSKEVDSLRQNNIQIPEWLERVENNCTDTIIEIPLCVIYYDTKKPNNTPCCTQK